MIVCRTVCKRRIMQAQAPQATRKGTPMHTIDTTTNPQGLHVHKLTGGELRHPWIITDDTTTLDLRAGRFTNRGYGWATRREAVAALVDILGGAS